MVNQHPTCKTLRWISTTIFPADRKIVIEGAHGDYLYSVSRILRHDALFVRARLWHMLLARDTPEILVRLNLCHHREHMLRKINKRTGHTIVRENL